MAKRKRTKTGRRTTTSRGVSSIESVIDRAPSILSVLSLEVVKLRRHEAIAQYHYLALAVGRLQCPPCRQLEITHILCSLFLPLALFASFSENRTVGIPTTSAPHSESNRIESDYYSPHPSWLPTIAPTMTWSLCFVSMTTMTLPAESLQKSQ